MTDREHEKQILKERDEARKGFKPKEGGDPLKDYRRDVGMMPKDEPKEIKDQKLRAKGLKPEEGGDPVENLKDDQKRFPGRVLGVGLGIKRGG